MGEIICKAIESCINQVNVHKDDYEVIVINDGSTDDTLEYIKKYKEVSNLTIIDKPNGGLSNTRNYGADHAKGDYILFLDGDDWYSPNALSILSKHIGEYDVIAFPMMHYYSEKEQQVKLNGLQEGRYERESFLHATLGAKQFNIIPAPQKIYRRSFLEKNNIRFVEGILHEDNPYFLDVMNACSEVFYIDEPLYYYLQKREGSITSQCTIRNFNGVMAGIEHSEELDVEKNMDVRFLNANMLVFQVVGDYKSKLDEKQVYSTLRSFKNKKRMVRYLFSETFSIKHTIRLVMLLIDPLLLRALIKLS
ncbi:MAG: glycosyltransferase [Lachnospiraceae bacterium]|nr:glycosyltransferase [Lachnospiraceae bacterium]